MSGAVSCHAAVCCRCRALLAAVSARILPVGAARWSDALQLGSSSINDPLDPEWLSGTEWLICQSSMLQ
jgi:hypothetical protein